ncbi:unnamed protein product [Cunninghamella echinulata]
MWGRLFHLTVDAVLISTILASIKRLTGIQPAVTKIPNKDIRNYVEQYLNIGEYTLDGAIIYMN